jgi:hypothetical protein
LYSALAGACEYIIRWKKMEINKGGIEINEREDSFAVEIIEEAKQETKRWRIAWEITMAALILSNLYWMWR